MVTFNGCRVALIGLGPTTKVSAECDTPVAKVGYGRPIYIRFNRKCSVGANVHMRG